MTEFWKRPKFWIGAIVILWLGYVIGANLEQTVTIHVVPWLVQPTAKVSTIVVAAGVVGCLLTLAVQFVWRRRSSKNASQSAAAAG